MIPAYSYSLVCSELSSAFKTRYPHIEEAKDKVRMTGLLFARPTSPLTIAEIIPNLDYYHHRSGNNIDLFCAGYGRYWRKRPGVEVVSKNGIYDDWLFSNKLFNDFREVVELKTKWKYSGGVDLILTNARYDEDDIGYNDVTDEFFTGAADLDFATAIVMNLDKAKSENAILSVETFFEQIFQYAESQTDNDPTWGFSDHMGVSVTGSAFKSLILSFLPEAVRSDIKKAFHFYVKDINP